MISNRWVRRAVGGLVTFAVSYVALALADADPDPVRLGLLVAICVGVLGLLLDALSDGGPSWDVPVDQPGSRTTGDPRLGRYLGLLESHLSARSRDTTVRDRLGVLADQVLRQRYGVSREDPHDEARAAELLGPELVAVLTGPARRLTPGEIGRCLTTIEEL